MTRLRLCNNVLLLSIGLYFLKNVYSVSKMATLKKSMKECLAILKFPESSSMLFLQVILYTTILATNDYSENNNPYCFAKTE